MKVMLRLVLLLACSIQSWAQGTVNFGNNTTTYTVINKVTNAKVVRGNTFIAELWYALGVTALWGLRRRPGG